MKPSSGRARSAATLAATAFRGVAQNMTSMTLGVALSASVGLALTVLPVSSAYAQKASPLPQGVATRDDTPAIDTSIAQKNWQASLTQLDARIASNPRDAQAKFKRGTVLAHLNRDDDAIAAFTELTQTYPELPEPYNNLAALYAKEGKYTEARAALETAVKVNPGYGLAYENLGDLYLRMSNEAYRRAQGLGKASATTTQRLADIQKIVSPAKRKATPAAKQAVTSEDDYTARASSNITQSTGFQFGGANGSLAQPPYMAPTR